MSQEIFENAEDELMRLALRAETKFKKYLPEEIAVELALETYSTAKEVDELLAPILDDPRLWKEYDYDGRIFGRKNGGFCRAFDGKNILESMRDAAASYLDKDDKAAALKIFRGALKDFVLSAKEAQLRWLETGSLKFVIDAESLRSAREASKEKIVRDLPSGEKNFFDQYEQQIKDEKNE